MTDLTAATTGAPAGGDTAAGRISRRRRSVSPSLVVSLLLLGAVLAVAGLSWVWTPYGLTEAAGPRLAGPSLETWAGTDRLGRDLATQLMLGARSAVIVAVATMALAAAIGVTVGVLAAAAQRWLDVTMQTVVDLLIAFPTLLLAMLVVTVRGASLSSAILAIGIAGSAIIARVSRINAARVLRDDYITAARAAGVSLLGVIMRHVLPNIAPLLAVQLMLLGGGAVLSEAALSYLGLGTPPPTASWGRMLREAQSTMAVQPSSAIFPGLAIAVMVLGLNLLADGLRERFDPSLGGRR